MRKPDFVIGGAERPYLLRWHLVPRNRFLNVYLHKIVRSDDDRALHDHPWWSLSIILAGGYLEVTPKGSFWRDPLDLVLRRATAAHRLVVGNSHPCWTLFITGPRIREWGFHCPQGWRHWKDFTHPAAKGQVGRGCA